MKDFVTRERAEQDLANPDTSNHSSRDESLTQPEKPLACGRGSEGGVDNARLHSEPGRVRSGQTFGVRNFAPESNN